MSLEITQREREGVAILELKGRIVAGSEVMSFRSAVEKAMSEPQPKVLLNLRGTDYIDSTGLGALVMFANQVKNAGGAARLVHINRRNIELLVMTKLDTMFEVFDDETDAVNSFFPGREIKRFDILSFVRQLQNDE